MPVPLIQLPKIEQALLPFANVMVFDVLNDISIVPIKNAPLIVVVEPDAGYVAAGNTAVSCGNGYMVASNAPPDVADQEPEPVAAQLAEPV